VETISGGSLAAVVPPPGYFSIIREICDRYEVLLILDEVMCGMGRSGRWFASEHFDVIPDIVTLGKGLAGGAIALSAVGVRTEHFNTIRDGSGVFVHGGTFTHHSVASAGGLAVVRILERENLVERAARSGEVLGEKFESQLTGHPHVGDIRGRGLLWGIELVENKETLKPFPRARKVAERMCKTLFQMGVLVYCSTGFAGGDGDALLIGPPFIIGEEEMDLLVDAIDQTLIEVLG
jgi:adenosylmethionine-8-amino-7-oxononanoate aminotransferase